METNNESNLSMAKRIQFLIERYTDRQMDRQVNEPVGHFLTGLYDLNNLERGFPLTI